MSTSALLSLIAAAWLTYPLAGAASVGVSVAEGKRPEGAGFSFLPELIVFPPIFWGIAYAVDQVTNRWGSWLIGSVCVLMVVSHITVIGRSFLILRKINTKT